MKKFVVSALAAAVGVLLYTRFLSDAHQLDLGRAVFVGLFTALGSVIFSGAGFNKNREKWVVEPQWLTGAGQKLPVVVGNFI
nr:hypothetical protein [uncultured Duganella sp.]